MFYEWGLDKIPAPAWLFPGVILLVLVIVVLTLFSSLRNIAAAKERLEKARKYCPDLSKLEEIMTMSAKDFSAALDAMLVYTKTRMCKTEQTACKNDLMTYRSESLGVRRGILLCIVLLIMLIASVVVLLNYYVF